MSQDLNEILEIGPSQRIASGDIAAAPDEVPAIGGWLILPAIGLVLGIIIGVVGLIIALSLVDSLPSRYHGIFALSLFVEFAILVAVVYAATRFFGKRRNTPATMITLYISVIVVHLLLLIVELAANAEPFAIETGKVLIRNVIGAAIWIPYFRVSKRVKETFVVP